jgi:hypothetical protein
MPEPFQQGDFASCHVGHVGQVLDEQNAGDQKRAPAPKLWSDSSVDAWRMLKIGTQEMQDVDGCRWISDMPMIFACNMAVL